MHSSPSLSPPLPFPPPYPRPVPLPLSPPVSRTHAYISPAGDRGCRDDSRRRLRDGLPGSGVRQVLAPAAARQIDLREGEAPPARAGVRVPRGGRRETTRCVVGLQGCVRVSVCGRSVASLRVSMFLSGVLYVCLYDYVLFLSLTLVLSLFVSICLCLSRCVSLCICLPLCGSLVSLCVYCSAIPSTWHPSPPGRQARLPAVVEVVAVALAGHFHLDWVTTALNTAFFGGGHRDPSRQQQSS